MATTVAPPSRTRGTPNGEPTWEITRLFPNQGEWTEGEYLALNTNQLVELSDGRLEFPPMPTTPHQLIVAFLYRSLLAFVDSRALGMVLFAPLRLRLWPEKFREPDIAFMLKEHYTRITKKFWEQADLVMEVVSEDDPHRDLVEKREDYARANIPEYWIVEPECQRVAVLRLEAGRYVDHAVGRAGQTVGSSLLPGFVVDVAEVFQSGSIPTA